VAENFQTVSEEEFCELRLAIMPRKSAAEQAQVPATSLCATMCSIIPGVSGLQDPSVTPFHIPRTGALFTQVRGTSILRSSPVWNSEKLLRGSLFFWLCGKRVLKYH
jgi:hypothetical protein